MWHKKQDKVKLGLKNRLSYAVNGWQRTRFVKQTNIESEKAD